MILSASRRFGVSAALIATVFVGSPDTATAMNKAELTDAIASTTGLSPEGAKAAIEAFVNNTTSALKKGDKISLVGFGTFSVSRAPAPLINPDGGLGKAIKLSYADGKGVAGTLTRGEAGTWELLLGIPDGDWTSDPLVLSAKFPGSFETKFVEIEIGLPETSRDVLKTFFETGDVPTSVAQVTLPADAFDFLPTVETDENFLAAYFKSFHTGAQTDSCEEALLSERLGFEGDALCVDSSGTDCALDASVEDGVVDAIAAATGVGAAEAAFVLETIRTLTYPATPAGTEVESLSAFGSFSISQRAARKGRNPQTGKAIKIAAKKVVKFKAGADLSAKVN